VPTTEYTPVNYDALAPGDIAWFRYNGNGQPRLVRVQPRGPHGQRYVCMVDHTTGADLPNGQVGVGWRELFRDAM
jgi:hypothetical protein